MFHGSHTAETKAKMSVAHRLRWQDADYRSKNHGNSGIPHSSETRAAIGASLKGRPLSEKHRAALSVAKSGNHLSERQRASIRTAARRSDVRQRLSASAHKHIEGDFPNCKCIHHVRVHAPSVSKLSLTMIRVLLAEFPEVIPEKRFGPYRVDAYLPPPYHLAFEADGEYWHRRTECERPGYYAQRDAYLLVHFSLPVVHLSERDI